MKSTILTTVILGSALSTYAGHPWDNGAESIRRFSQRQDTGGPMNDAPVSNDKYLFGSLPGGQGKETIDQLLAEHAKGADIRTLLNLPHAGKVPHPPSAAALRQQLPPRIPFWHPASQTVKLRYGPYLVPNATAVGKFGGHGGMLYNYPDLDVDVPCGDCRIVGISADLEYADGASANVTNGMWLHHYVHFVVGEGKVDATCGETEESLPHLIVGQSPRTAERFFSSGNEKTLAAFFGGKKLAGYKLRKEDKMALIVDFMNENAEDKVVYLTVTYDYVEGDPEGYGDVKPIWFDIVKCGTSELPSPQSDDFFQITSPPWTASLDGEILGWAGHIHDGGTAVIALVDGQPNGISNASYTQYTVAQSGNHHSDSGAAGGHGNGHGVTADGKITHLSGMAVVVGTDLSQRRMETGQKWEIKATYDYGMYTPSVGMDGKPENIMGIAVMFVLVD